MEISAQLARNHGGDGAEMLQQVGVDMPAGFETMALAHPLTSTGLLILLPAGLPTHGRSVFVATFDTSRNVSRWQRSREMSSLLQVCHETTSRLAESSYPSSPTNSLSRSLPFHSICRFVSWQTAAACPLADPTHSGPGAHVAIYCVRSLRHGVPAHNTVSSARRAIRARSRSKAGAFHSESNRLQ